MLSWADENENTTEVINQTNKYVLRHTDVEIKRKWLNSRPKLSKLNNYSERTSAPTPPDRKFSGFPIIGNLQTLLAQNDEVHPNIDITQMQLTDSLPARSEATPVEEESDDPAANENSGANSEQVKPNNNPQSDYIDTTQNRYPDSTQAPDTNGTVNRTVAGQSTTVANPVYEDNLPNAVDSEPETNESTQPSEISEPADDSDKTSWEQRLVGLTTELRECSAENQQLIEALVGLEEDHSRQLEARERTFIAEKVFFERTISELNLVHQHDRRTNIRLNEELLQLQDQLQNAGDKQCLTESEQTKSLQLIHEAMLEQYAELEAKHLESQERIKELESLLDGQNMPTKFGFSYVGGLFNSYVKSSEAESIISTGRRLTQEQCGEAMEWLVDQKEDQRALVKRIWVWNSYGEALVCRFVGLQNYTLEDSTPVDEAHLVVFR